MCSLGAGQESVFWAFLEKNIAGVVCKEIRDLPRVFLGPCPDALHGCLAGSEFSPVNQPFGNSFVRMTILIVVSYSDFSFPGNLKLAGSLNLQKELVNRIRQPGNCIAAEVLSFVDSRAVIVWEQLPSLLFYPDSFAFQLWIKRGQVNIDQIIRGA